MWDITMKLPLSLQIRIVPSGVILCHGPLIGSFIYQSFYVIVWRTKCLHIFLTTNLVQKIHWQNFYDMTHGLTALQQFIDLLNTVQPIINSLENFITSNTPFFRCNDVCQRRPILKQWNIYLNYHIEIHPSSLKKSIPYSQFLKLKKIHAELLNLLEAQTPMYCYFLWKDYPHKLILHALEQSQEFPRDNFYPLKLMIFRGM